MGHSARAGLDYAPAITREFKLGPDDQFADDPHTALAAPEAEPVVADEAAEVPEGAEEGGAEAAEESPAAEEATGETTST